MPRLCQDTQPLCHSLNFHLKEVLQDRRICHIYRGFAIALQKGKRCQQDQSSATLDDLLVRPRAAVEHAEVAVQVLRDLDQPVAVRVGLLEGGLADPLRVDVVGDLPGDLGRIRTR